MRTFTNVWMLILRSTGIEGRFESENADKKGALTPYPIASCVKEGCKIFAESVRKGGRGG